MEPKKTTDSQSTSSLQQRLRAKENDTHYHSEPVDRRMDSDYGHLNENDCWFYQNEIERTIRAGLPDSMNKRFVAMLWHLGAQARKAVKP